jgi:hypothetical protein
MPRERIDLFRISDSMPKEKIFVLAYEGNNTEPIYFEKFKESKRFNNDLIYLYSLRRPKGDTKSSPKHVFNKLKKEVKDLYTFEKDDELWMIIDRDSWTDIQEISTLCKEEGNFFLALSNPCFEFWLLLHIKKVSDFNEKQLTDIFENKMVSAKKTYLKKLLSTILRDGYNESNPKPRRFLKHIDLAIERAKQLDLSGEEYPTKLGSHVYKLVEKIIK